MDYFLKKKKWMACLVLLTFLFTSIMPTNLAAGDSMAWAADYSASVAKGSTVTLNGSSDFPATEDFWSWGSFSYSEFRYANCTWSSDDTSVATVSGNGKTAIVTGVKAGTVTITATATYKRNNNSNQYITKTWTVTVTDSSAPGGSGDSELSPGLHNPGGATDGVVSVDKSATQVGLDEYEVTLTMQGGSVAEYIEIALALDASTSMTEARIKAGHDALINMIDVLVANKINAKISVSFFAGSLRGKTQTFTIMKVQNNELVQDDTQLAALKNAIDTEAWGDKLAGGTRLRFARSKCPIDC